MDTKNIKCTWPRRDPTPGDPTQTIFHWLAFALGATQLLVFLDTNMLVSPMQNSCVGGIAQCDGPTRMFFHVAVEYRLESSGFQEFNFDFENKFVV